MAKCFCESILEGLRIQAAWIEALASVMIENKLTTESKWNELVAANVKRREPKHEMTHEEFRRLLAKANQPHKNDSDETRSVLNDEPPHL